MSEIIGGNNDFEDLSGEEGVAGANTKTGTLEERATKAPIRARKREIKKDYVEYHRIIDTVLNSNIFDPISKSLEEGGIILYRGRNSTQLFEVEEVESGLKYVVLQGRIETNCKRDHPLRGLWTLHSKYSPHLSLDLKVNVSGSRRKSKLKVKGRAELVVNGIQFASYYIDPDGEDKFSVFSFPMQLKRQSEPTQYEFLE